MKVAIAVFVAAKNLTAVVNSPSIGIIRAGKINRAENAAAQQEPVSFAAVAAAGTVAVAIEVRADDVAGSINSVESGTLSAGESNRLVHASAQQVTTISFGNGVLPDNC